jgi:hypothetical protein
MLELDRHTRCTPEPTRLHRLRKRSRIHQGDFLMSQTHPSLRSRRGCTDINVAAGHSVDGLAVYGWCTNDLLKIAHGMGASPLPRPDPYGLHTVRGALNVPLMDVARNPAARFSAPGSVDGTP